MAGRSPASAPRTSRSWRPAGKFPFPAWIGSRRPPRRRLLRGRAPRPIPHPCRGTPRRRRRRPRNAAPAQPAFGKLVVFFVQANMDPSRIKGQINLREQTRKLLATLGSEDRAAVLSFDSHLKLWQDFTLDREAVHQALDHAMRFGGKDPER